MGGAVSDWLLGVDVGASGSRLALVPLGVMVREVPPTLVGERLSVGVQGSTGAAVAVDLVARAVAELDDERRAGVRAVAAGIAGLGTNVADPSSYLPGLRELVPGAQVVLASDMVTAQTSGNVMVVLGDFSRYIIYDRLGVNLEFIQNVVDGSGIPTGQRGLVAVKRVGADVADLGAFRFLKA